MPGIQTQIAIQNAQKKYNTTPNYQNIVTSRAPTYNYLKQGISPSPAATTTPIQQAVSNLATAQNAISSGGESGIALQVSTVPAATVPAATFPTYTVNVPNLTYNPSESEKADLLAQAVKKAGLVIDPQVLSANQGYENFNALAQNQINEVNPQYDALSNAIANVFKNTVNQNLINNAIRRGATESG